MGRMGQILRKSDGFVVEQVSVHYLNIIVTEMTHFKIFRRKEMTLKGGGGGGYQLWTA